MKRIFLRTSEFKNLSTLSFYSKKHHTHKRAYAAKQQDQDIDSEYKK
jgi:hypothetical protein